MATLAAYFKRPSVMAETMPQVWIEESDPYALRPLPCEDVYFFSKKINNMRLVRQADPRETRRAVHVAATFCIVLAFVVALMAPKGLGMAAGYEFETLKVQHSKLLEERATLELEEARLLNPQRMAELAKTLQLEDPTPAQVTTLNPQSSNSVAWDMTTKKR